MGGPVCVFECQLSCQGNSDTMHIMLQFTGERQTVSLMTGVVLINMDQITERMN